MFWKRLLRPVVYTCFTCAVFSKKCCGFVQNQCNSFANATQCNNCMIKWRVVTHQLRNVSYKPQMNQFQHILRSLSQVLQVHLSSNLELNRINVFWTTLKLTYLRIKYLGTKSNSSDIRLLHIIRYCPVQLCQKIRRVRTFLQ